MQNIQDYLDRANEIIGERTEEEVAYDNEVIKYLEKYGKIRKAVNKANKVYPKQALKYNDDNIGEIQSHYDYLLQHMQIIRKLSN